MCCKGSGRVPLTPLGEQHRAPGDLQFGLGVDERKERVDVGQASFLLRAHGGGDLQVERHLEATVRARARDGWPAPDRTCTTVLSSACNH